ncbi:MULTISPECIES: hypothetical protein [Bradyrhizobiaceae]|uniref:hypothetical protein n=1 Tax=Afipia birgiae TaxID=151414 RepID=UPI000369C498
MAKAEIAQIVTSAPPRSVGIVDPIEDVRVTEPAFAIPLAIALRESPISLAGPPIKSS